MKGMGTDVTVFGVTVVKNEAHRYLESSLAWHADKVDRLFVFDDQSTDNSVEIAQKYADVVVRPEEVPTFLDDESAFRQAGWDAWVETQNPEPWDFIFTFDVDEFWDGPSLRIQAKTWDYYFTGGIVHRPEIWDVVGPIIRVDGYWQEIDNIRFFPYQTDGEFRKQLLAGGSHPTYAENRTKQITGNLLHCGYSTPEDRQERYDRYICRGGHNPKHIQSILQQPPVLDQYVSPYGELPKMVRAS